jgi:hypothetical protein
MIKKLIKHERWMKRRVRRSEETVVSPRFAKFKKGDLVQRRALRNGGFSGVEIQKIFGMGFVVKVSDSNGQQIVDVHWQGLGRTQEDVVTAIEHAREPSVEKVTLPKGSK